MKMKGLRWLQYAVSEEQGGREGGVLWKCTHLGQPCIRQVLPASPLLRGGVWESFALPFIRVESGPFSRLTLCGSL